jgi:ribose 5-phosphate isomerase B
MTKLFIGSDHGALELKDKLVAYLKTITAIDLTDCGTFDTQSVDYPDIADSVVKQVLNDSNNLGILCCGTGIGISIKANRNKGIRAALVYDEFTSKMAKEHNNANILCLGGRTTSFESAKIYISTWLNSAYEGGRHQRRLDKLDN